MANGIFNLFPHVIKKFQCITLYFSKPLELPPTIIIVFSISNNI